PVTFSFFMALPFGNMLESGLLDKLIESPPDFCLISLAIIIGTFWLAVRITPKFVNLMEQGEAK
ncbi:MAG: hypothetical protein NTX82_07670, partial [Candidatus Parcubacteria bacterium]|nr:hypothetical protein [Candidatus Parcubacteria bacterium]